MHLSEKMVGILYELQNKHPMAEFTMIDRTIVSGRIAQINGNLTLINVSQLHTPLGIYREATLRTADLLYISIDTLTYKV